MINQRLYDALDRLHIACGDADVQEVGGQPLQKAWQETGILLNEIDQRPTIKDALSAAIDFAARYQSEEADALASMLVAVLNSLNQRGVMEADLENLCQSLRQSLEATVTYLQDEDNEPTCEWWALNDAAEAIDRALGAIENAISPREYPDGAYFVIEDEEVAAKMDALGKELQKLEAFPI